MYSSFSHTGKHLILFGLLCLSFIMNLYLGSVHIPFMEIVNILTGGIDEIHSSWQFIILQYRLPKTFVAILTGAGLSWSGLLMQALFRNPLADPFILGISSGAGLGVAVLYMGLSLIGIHIGLSGTLLASTLGSFIVLSVIMIISRRVQGVTTVLIIGVMFSSFAGAIINILSYFSTSDTLKQFIFWSLGSIGNLPYSHIIILVLFVGFGGVLTFISTKGLNALLLGENYARSVGVHFSKLKVTILISATLLAGGITSLVGPIAFIGLAVPHLVRQLYRTLDHRVLFIATGLGGAIVLLVCDTLAQIPFKEFSLPINAITSLLGAPLVIWILLKRKHLIF